MGVEGVACDSSEFLPCPYMPGRILRDVEAHYGLILWPGGVVGIAATQLAVRADFLVADAVVVRRLYFPKPCGIAGNTTSLISQNAGVPSLRGLLRR